MGQPEGIQGEITAAVEEFERNLQELSQDGRNLPELSAQLQEVGRQWQQFMSTLTPEISHTRPGQQIRAVVAEADRLLRHVDTAVKLYERLTSG